MLILSIALTHQTLLSVARADRSWDNPNGGNWSAAVNWSPNGVPGVAEVARLGNLAGIELETVTLDQDDTVSGLELTNEMWLRTDGHKLTVLGDTLISDTMEVAGVDRRSRLDVDDGPDAVDFDTDNLDVNNGGNLRLKGGVLEIDDRLTIDQDSFFSGYGRVQFNDTGVVLRNDNNIHVTKTASPTGLTFDVMAGGFVDLDGAFGDGSYTLVGSANDDPERHRFTINGGQLADPFSGSLSIGLNDVVTFDFDAPWETDSGSINFSGSVAGANAGVLDGAEVTIGGSVATSIKGNGRIEADANFASAASVNLPLEGKLVVAGETVVQGGEFSLSEDATLDFDGDTTVRGGTFTTHSNLSSNGSVDFNGQTDWDGIVTVNGIARQVGDAGVSGPTTINAGVLDMDGGGGTTWNIGNVASINAAHIDSTISDSFDGTINVGGGFLPRLVINLDDPSAQWTMAGELNLSNLGFVPFSVRRLAGSDMRVTGDLNVTNLVGINAPTTFDNSSVTNFASATSVLSMHGRTVVRPGATFVGQGALANTSAEGMTLEDGVSLDETGLVNAGLLEIGSSPGIAAVDRFENTTDGTWLVEIGGHVAGDEHDLLLVTRGTTELDGLIEVDLIDAGGGLFFPEIGDEFTVLTSLGAVSGMFSNDPVSMAAGQSFHWEVLHHPNDVTLRLVNINDVVPEPASFLLATLGVSFFAGLRQQEC